MSPSSIDPLLVDVRQPIALYMGQAGVCWAQQQPTNWVAHEACGDAVVGQGDAGMSFDAARESLEDQAAIWARHRGELHVILPDPWAIVSMLELASLPRRADDRQALAAWKLQNDFHLTSAPTVAVQDFGRDGQNHLMLAVGMDSAVIERAQKALASAGIQPWSMGVAGLSVLNVVRPQLEGEAGALLVLTREFTTLMVVDASGRLRHFDSRWRTFSMADEASVRALAQRIDLSLSALAAQRPRWKCRCVHVVGEDSSEAGILGQAIARRTGSLAIETQCQAAFEHAPAGAWLAGVCLLDRGTQ